MALYAYKDKNGKLLHDTLAESREGSFYEVFYHLSEDEQRSVWKNIPATKRLLKKKGYRVVKVGLVEMP